MRAAADDERRFVDITEFANERNINGSERKRRGGIAAAGLPALF
jgi:hypothetical protein